MTTLAFLPNNCLLWPSFCLKNGTHHLFAHMPNTIDTISFAILYLCAFKNFITDLTSHLVGERMKVKNFGLCIIKNRIYRKVPTDTYHNRIRKPNWLAHLPFTFPNKLPAIHWVCEELSFWSNICYPVLFKTNWNVEIQM